MVSSTTTILREPMIVTCPSCTAKYRLSDEKIQGRGARITCPTCTHRFVVYRNEEAPAPAPVSSLASSGTVNLSRGVPVTIARQGQVVRAQVPTDPEEEAPTTLMPHGSGLLDGSKRPSMPAADEEDPEYGAVAPSSSAPAQSAARASAASSRFATYLVVTVVGTAILVFLISSGFLG